MKTHNIAEYGEKQDTRKAAAAHTPGPLTVSRDTTIAAQWTVLKSHGHQPNAEQAGVGHVRAVALCYHEADAKLYAASPALLEALESIAFNLENRAMSGEQETAFRYNAAAESWRVYLSSLIITARNEARAAIAKATS